MAMVWLALEIASVMKKLLMGELSAVLADAGADAETALMYSPFIQTAPCMPLTTEKWGATSARRDRTPLMLS